MKKGGTRTKTGYVVATFDKFPGVRIPLLTDEECRERGIEPGRLPPFDTWTPEQQRAGHELQQIFGDMAVRQVYRILLRHLKDLPNEGPIPADFEEEA